MPRIPENVIRLLDVGGTIGLRNELSYLAIYATKQQNETLLKYKRV